MNTTPELSPNAPPVAPPKRSNCCCLGCSLAVVFLLVVLGVGYRICVYAPPLRISEETTRITGPLTRDGQIDFFKALEKLVYPKELATDENGYRLFVRAFGPLDLERLDNLSEADRENYRLQKYEKLGLDPSTLPSLTLPESPYEILKRHYQKEGEDTGPLVNKKLSAPWTLDDLPMLADWLAQIDAPLDVIAEMVRRPVFCSPFLEDPESLRTGKPQDLLSLLLPDVHFFRELARQFQVRALYRIAAGNIDGAIDDAITLLEFGRKAGAQGTVIPLLTGFAMEGQAFLIPLSANPEHQLNAEQMQRFLAAMDALPPRPPLSRYYEAERLTGLSYLQAVLKNGKNSMTEDSTGVMNFSLIICDQNIAYQRVNKMYDEIIDGRIEDSQLDDDGSKFVENYVLRYVWTAKGRGILVAKLFCFLFQPSTEMVEKILRRVECSYQMKRLVLALLRYESEHGKPPDADWPTAIRDYLGDNPDRYFSCPAAAAEPGETTYALVRYADGERPKRLDTLLLVELKEPVPLAEATISAEELLQEAKLPEPQRRIGSRHYNSMNVGYRNGAVEIFSPSSDWTDAQALREKLGLGDPEE